MTRLSAIIVNYDSGSILAACLSSLIENLLPISYEIFVVNNDLPSDLDRLPKQEWPNTHFIQNHANVGFATAANRGYLRSQSEFVLLVNPDIVVQPGSIDALMETIDSHADVGIAVPLLRNPDGSLQYSCRRFYTFSTLLLRRAPLRWLYPSHPLIQEHLMLDWNHDVLAEVDWGLGAAMMIRRAAVEGPGLFDERFFLYFEDVDLCLRMWRRGWRVLFNPEATMVHLHRRDSSKHWFHSAKRHHFTSMMRFIWKYRGKLGTRAQTPGECIRS
jgi:GT2 family glycosyltransferase